MPNKLRHWTWLLIISVGLMGCVSAPKPVVPQPISVSSPSFDGSHADSGLVGTTGEEFIISASAYSRYNALIAKYGNVPEFVVPLRPDHGVRDAPSEIVSKYARGKLYLMTAEAMTNFVRMSRWQREGR